MRGVDPEVSLSAAEVLVAELVDEATATALNRLAGLANTGALTGETALVFVGRLLGQRDVLLEIKARERKLAAQRGER